MQLPATYLLERSITFTQFSCHCVTLSALCTNQYHWDTPHNCVNQLKKANYRKVLHTPHVLPPAPTFWCHEATPVVFYHSFHTVESHSYITHSGFSTYNFPTRQSPFVERFHCFWRVSYFWLILLYCWDSISESDPTQFFAHRMLGSILCCSCSSC